MKADEALEEALCFGWIDGQMKSMNETSYRKYFSLRRDNSKWSEKNKKLVEQLEKQGIMTDYGRKKIEEAKQLLLFTDYSFQEISSLLNFTSQSHFTQRFKQICGQTPKGFRDKNFQY